MSYSISIGPYKMTGEEPFVSPKTKVVDKTNGSLKDLEHVARYIDACESTSNSKLGEQIRQSLNKKNYLFFKDLQPGHGKKEHSPPFELDCKSETVRSRAFDKLEIHSCNYVWDDISIPVQMSSNDICRDDMLAGRDPFFERFGNQMTEGKEKWNCRFASCHAYAIGTFLGLDMVAALDGIPKNKFHIEKIPGDKDRVNLVPQPGKNAVEMLLKGFFRPIGFISHKDVPMTLEINEYSLTRYAGKFFDDYNKRFDRKLNEMIDSGHIDRQKALDGKYLFVISERVPFIGTGRDESAIISVHSGILRCDMAGHWQLESKLSLSKNVYSSPVGMQAVIQYAAQQSMSFNSRFFYRIYEVDNGDGSPCMNIDELSKNEPPSGFPLIFKAVKTTKTSAPETLKFYNEQL